VHRAVGGHDGGAIGVVGSTIVAAYWTPGRAGEVGLTRCVLCSTLLVLSNRYRIPRSYRYVCTW